MRFGLLLLINMAYCCIPVSAQSRTPREVAEQLAANDGRKLGQVACIPALPLVAKLHLSELKKNTKHSDEVRIIVEPFLNRQ